jgi:glycosyltransferase involved in cell wall biosynthesis
MSAPAIGGLASVIIPCWNQLEFTRQCIVALMRQTGANWELIVVNNGSSDGTADYLGGVQDASPVPVTVIANGTNRGFPAAINQGLQYARGEYLVLLNNDVVVTDGWLRQMIALASVAVTAERDEDTHGRVFTTESPEDTEVKALTVSQFSEVKDAYPVQKITVIDHSLGRIEGNGDNGHQTGRIGLVGPMSNYAAPPQLVEDVGYQDMEGMRDFARRWRDEQRGKWFTVPKLSGFCMLMKRAVYDAIGGLDERFGLGFFDDDDLAERARRAGFELAVAYDLFVHHFGSRTFVGNGIDAERVLAENERRFAAKWGNTVPQGRRVTLRAWNGAEGTGDRHTAGLELQTQWPKNGSALEIASRPTVTGTPVSATRDEPGGVAMDRARTSLTMIVRDEEKNLSSCLESVRGVFDEIVVLDTGSKDRTVEIARSFGARVFDFVWVDDFAAARNAALARATGDYAFWLDADDLIEAPERAKLERLLGELRRGSQDGVVGRLGGGPQNGTGTGILGRSQSPFAFACTGESVASAFVVRCACDPGPDGSGGETVVDHIRLFPLIEGVRWTYRVHEQILPALKRAGVPVQWTDITVRHTGYSDRELRSRKLDRDCRILSEELAERPDDPFTLFNLGSIAIERADWGGALEYLRRSLAGSAPTDSITRKLFALIARAHQMRGDFPAALRSCAEGLSFDSEDAELWFRKAVVHRHSGEPAEAEHCWRRILTLSRPQKFASVDQGIYGHLTRRNLAALAKERGDAEEAQRQWRAVLGECPRDGEALRYLGEHR